MLTRLVKIQLAIFAIATVVAVAAMAFNYIQVQEFLGVGRKTVTLELPAAGGLYRFGNVTYRGVQVGRVTNVELVKDGARRYVKATLSLDSAEKIPANVDAKVRSVSAIGEQYVDLIPRDSAGPYLTDGSVIPLANATIPQPVGPLLDKTSELLGSIPQGQLSSLLDELHTAFNAAEYDLQSLFDSTARLSGPLDQISHRTRALIEDGALLLDTQVDSADAIRTWTRSLAGFTDQVVADDPPIRSLLQTGPAAINEASRLLNDLSPTIPVLLANLSSLGQVMVTYHPALEQILVLLPPAVSIVQAVNPNRNAQGLGLGSFRITLNDPPACTVGFLPPSAWRPPYDTTTVDTPDGVYCKLPQDSPIAVRGVRNIPCMTKPWKRAPTVEICDSDQEFEPIAQKQPVLGPYPRDPGLEAQGVPPDSRWFPDQGLYNAPGQGPPAPDTRPSVTPPTTMLVPPPANNEEQPMPPPMLPDLPPPTDTPAVRPPAAPEQPGPQGPTPNAVNNGAVGYRASSADPAAAVVSYNPRTGEFFGPDGKLYRQSDLATRDPERSWKELVLDQS